MSKKAVSDQQKAEAVIAGIAGGESMRRACAAAGVKPPTFCLWVTKDADLAEQYARARDVRAEIRADQIDELADKIEAGVLAPDVGRVVIDARKWAASKLAPKRYGDKQQIEHSGEIKQSRGIDEIKGELATLLADPELKDLLAQQKLLP